jgi:catechol 2,3-dioxygenase-like lactoylglutathione lyase family enzyme
MLAVRIPSHREHIMDWTLEVVILPVSDIDRSIAFYRDKVGFDLDHDTRNEHMHVVQLTPHGSGCSIVFGDLPSQREMEPGSIRGLQLVVADAAAARQELLGRGVEASELVSFGD